MVIPGRSFVRPRLTSDDAEDHQASGHAPSPESLPSHESFMNPTPDVSNLICLCLHLRFRLYALYLP